MGFPKNLNIHNSDRRKNKLIEVFQVEYDPLIKEGSHWNPIAGGQWNLWKNQQAMISVLHSFYYKYIMFYQNSVMLFVTL